MDYVGRPRPRIHMMRLRSGMDLSVLLRVRTYYDVVGFCYRIGISTRTYNKARLGHPIRVDNAFRIASGLEMNTEDVFEHTSITQKTWGNRFGYVMKRQVVQKLIAERGWDIQKAAKMCKVHMSTLYKRLANGDGASVRFSTAVNIAEGLKVPLEQIFEFRKY